MTPRSPVVCADLEGRPVAGTRSALSRAHGACQGRADRLGRSEPATAPIGARVRWDRVSGQEFSPSESTSLFPAVVTDAGSGFHITGVGRERLADLIVEGPSIRWTEGGLGVDPPAGTVRVPLFHGRPPL